MDTLAELRQKYRIFGISIIDYIKAYIFIFIILLIFRRKPHPIYFLSILPLSIIAHTIFNQETVVIKRLKSKDINPTKIIVVVLSLIIMLY